MKHFRKFIEEVDSADQKSKEDRSEIANQRFEIQKQKAKKEVEVTKDKLRDSKEKSSVPFNRQKSVKFNKSTGELPTLNKKEKK